MTTKIGYDHKIFAVKLFRLVNVLTLTAELASAVISSTTYR